eukprot:TRINITY_DN76159_c0_g1_i1.p1 TRINITY_DN76159_c0_g1~~TRINITY_DN76159_c0_g1_i1.p1  ORF type:complete len:312 (+),score=50.02 TRINITY_DN76159_c0_g1_i1:109-1044(+)
MAKRKSAAARAAARAAAVTAHAAAVKAAAVRRMQETQEENCAIAGSADAAVVSTASPRMTPLTRQSSAGATPRPGLLRRKQASEDDELEDDGPEEGAEVAPGASSMTDVVEPTRARDMIWTATQLLKEWEPRLRRIEEREVELAVREAHLVEWEARLAGDNEGSNHAEVLVAIGFEKCAMARIADLIASQVPKKRKAALQRAARNETRCWVNDLLARQRALFDLWQAYTELDISDSVESERIVGYAFDAMHALSKLCKGMQSHYFQGKLEGLKQLSSESQNVVEEAELAPKSRRRRRRRRGGSSHIDRRDP